MRQWEHPGTYHCEQRHRFREAGNGGAPEVCHVQPAVVKGQVGRPAQTDCPTVVGVEGLLPGGSDAVDVVRRVARCEQIARRIERETVRHAPDLLGIHTHTAAREVYRKHPVRVALHHEQRPLIRGEREPVGVAEAVQNHLARAIRSQAQQLSIALHPVARVRYIVVGGAVEQPIVRANHAAGKAPPFARRFYAQVYPHRFEKEQNDLNMQLIARNARMGQRPDMV